MYFNPAYTTSGIYEIRHLRHLFWSPWLNYSLYFIRHIRHFIFAYSWKKYVQRCENRTFRLLNISYLKIALIIRILHYIDHLLYIATSFTDFLAIICRICQITFRTLSYIANLFSAYTKSGIYGINLLVPCDVVYAGYYCICTRAFLIYLSIFKAIWVSPGA